MTEASPSLTNRQLIALVAILALAGFLRFYRIGVPSLWTDELWSIEMAMGHGSVHDTLPDGVIRFDQPVPTDLASAAPWWQIWTHVQIVTHPPLYYIVLRGWMNLFGNGPAAGRSLSALISLVGIFLFFDVCRLLHGPRIALLAAAIMTLAIGQIDLAQESRSYTLLILEEIAACDIVARMTLLGATRRRLILFVFLVSAMVLTHYLCLGILAALALVAPRLRASDRRKIFAAFAVAGVVLLAVWGYGFREQLRTIPFSDPTYFHEIFPHHVANSFLAIVRLPLQYLFGEELGLRIPLGGHILAALLAAILIVRAFRQRNLFLWAVLLTTTIVMVTAIDLYHDSTLLQYSRYTVVAAPALFAMLANIRWPGKSAAPLCLVATLAVLNAWQMYRPVPPRQDFQNLAEVIDSHATPDELLVFYNQSDWLSPGMWYMGYKYYSPASGHPWITLHRPPDPPMLRQLQSRKTLWLIGRTPEIFGPIILPGWRPIRLWHTSAGGVCLMQNANPLSVR